MDRWPKEYPSFLWGTATSSHQIEGNQTNDWTQFEHTGHGTEPSLLALDHWNRYEEDFDLLQQLGINSYRFSLEWSRIEPRPGEFDAKAIDHYRAMILSLKRRHIMPLMTLHHFTLPIWVAERGGFLHPEGALWFKRYVDTVMDALGDLVDLYVTINEPLVFTVMGYIIGIWPPALHGFRRAFKLIDRLAEIHKVAYTTIKEKKPLAWVGLAHHLIAFHPWRHAGLDLAMTGLVRYLMNDRFIAMIEPYEDFLGVNYYTRQYIRFSHGLHPIQARPENPQSSLGWEIYPEGLSEVLTRLKRYQKPMIITENGISTLDDAQRTAYIEGHLNAISDSQRAGLPIRGYYYWSAFDNFEWAEGYGPRFGLIHIDYDSLKRTMRASGEYYRTIIQASGDSYPIIVPQASK